MLFLNKIHLYNWSPSFSPSLYSLWQCRKKCLVMLVRMNLKYLHKFISSFSSPTSSLPSSFTSFAFFFAVKISAWRWFIAFFSLSSVEGIFFNTRKNFWKWVASSKRSVICNPIQTTNSNSNLNRTCNHSLFHVAQLDLMKYHEIKLNQHSLLHSFQSCHMVDLPSSRHCFVYLGSLSPWVAHESSQLFGSFKPTMKLTSTSWSLSIDLLGVNIRFSIGIIDNRVRVITRIMHTCLSDMRWK